MNSTKNPGGLKRVADSISGFDDPSLGDERERDVSLRAYTFAMLVGIYLSFTLAVIMAVVGFGSWSALVAVGGGIPSWLAIWYCAQEGVDLTALANRARPWRKRLTYATMTVFLVLWLGAMTYHMISGAPLIRVGVGTDSGGTDPATAAGLLTGAAAGLVAAVMATKATSRAVDKRNSRESDDD